MFNKIKTKTSELTLEEKMSKSEMDLLNKLTNGVSLTPEEILLVDKQFIDKFNESNTNQMFDIIKNKNITDDIQSKIANKLLQFVKIDDCMSINFLNYVTDNNLLSDKLLEIANKQTLLDLYIQGYVSREHIEPHLQNPYELLSFITPMLEDDDVWTTYKNSADPANIWDLHRMTIHDTYGWNLLKNDYPELIQELEISNDDLGELKDRFCFVWYEAKLNSRISQMVDIDLADLMKAQCYNALIPRISTHIKYGRIINGVRPLIKSIKLEQEQEHDLATVIDIVTKIINGNFDVIDDIDNLTYLAHFDAIINTLEYVSVPSDLEIAINNKTKTRSILCLMK